MNNTAVVVDNSDVNLIALISFLNKTISQYILGSIWLLGNIGSVLTCAVLHRPSFRKSPCAMYFVASTFSQLLTFNFALTYRILQFGFDVRTINANLWFCKMRFYLLYVLLANARCNIIMATVDRFFASSRNALRRQWSSSKVALRVIVCNAIFWSLAYVHVLVFFTIDNSGCQPRAGAYGIFFSIYITIDSGVLPILLMLIFGVLTVNNVRQTARRVEPAGRSQRGVVSKKDSQLLRMLVNQIILFIFLNLPNPCYLIYQSITMPITKSAARTTVEAFVNNMTYVMLYLNYALTFENFFVSSKMFRREFRNLVLTKILRRPARSTDTDGGTQVRRNPTNVGH